KGEVFMKKISYIQDFPSWKAGFEFFVPVKVRFSETDMFGHLNNTVPFVYFETARIEYIHYLGLYRQDLKEMRETIPVVANQQCDYIRQVYFDEELNIYVKINEVGNSSVDLHYLGVKGDDTVCFTGRGTIVNINKNSGKSVPWTSEEREIFFKEMNVNVV